MTEAAEFSADYNRVVAEYYDSAYQVVLETDADVQFYAALAQETGGPVLELGCGTGRVLLELQRRGLSCVGLDSSKAMLDKLRERAGADAPELVCAQMQRFDLGPRRFPLIYSAFRAFQHLYSVDDQLACLGNVLRHLDPGGRFAFDVFNPRPERIGRPDQSEREDIHFTHAGAEVVRYVTEGHDPLNQLIELGMRFETREAGRVVKNETEQLRMRWFTRYELEHLLMRAGFADVTIYGDFARAPVSKDAPALVVVGTAPR